MNTEADRVWTKIFRGAFLFFNVILMKLAKCDEQLFIMQYE